jgi:hypothetical protein
MVSDAPKLKRRKRNQKEILKKGMILVSGLAFFGVFGGSAIIGLYRAGLNPDAQPSVETTEVDPANDLAEMERGYLLVLEREPANQIALEGLVQTRLDMGKPEEAIPPLETLVRLNPEREDYQQLLDSLQEHASVQ